MSLFESRTIQRILPVAVVGGVILAGCSTSHTEAQPKAPVTTTAPAIKKAPPTTTETTAPNCAVAFSTERSALQAGVPAVNSAELQELISVIATKGYIDPQLPDTKRFVAEGSNGTSYTAELDYSGPSNNSSSALEAVAIYLQKPGEPHAEQVIGDGSYGLDDPSDHPAIDGLIDTAIGYVSVTDAEISADVAKYGECANEYMDNQALQADSQQIQADYITAVDQILAHS